MRIYAFIGGLGIAAQTCLAATITVTNQLDLPRPSETIVLKWEDVLAAIPGAKVATLIVAEGDKEITSQPVDLNGDDKPDEFIFQTDLAAKQSKTFELKPATGVRPLPESRAFGRFVPERNDDYMWENDRILFRLYGPKLAIVEPASSGVDTICKSTRAIMMNRLIASYHLGPHVNHGEIVDCYKVGFGRGVGGIAVYKNDKLYNAGHFLTWRTIASGPIRAQFELTYAPYDADGVKVSEVKRVSLDAGQNLSHFETFIKTEPATATLPIAIGLAKHPQPGSAALHKEQGWVRYWDPADPKGNGNVGTALVLDPAAISDTKEIADHVLVLTTADTGKPLSHWAGAGWDRSGDFADVAAWDAYIEQFAKRQQSPVKVELKK